MSEARETQAVHYAEAGVDFASRSKFAASLPGILARARRPEVISDAGPFSGLFQLGSSYRNPVLASSADGIGTKVRLQMAANRLDLCGHDILGHSVNDLLACGAMPLFFLDYIAGNGLSVEQKQALVAGVAEACAEAGCALLGGETADMPDVYTKGEFDLAGFIVGVVERDEILDGSRVAEGDILIGLPSSGLHTNGFSLARRVLDVGNGEPEGVTRERLAERPDVLGGQSLGDALLATHRPYHRLLQPYLARIHALAHITGGGYAENVPRVLPAHLAARIDVRSWEVPGIFKLIQNRGEISPAEMYEVFNMGMGMVVFAAPEDADELLSDLAGAVRVGSVTARSGSAVVLENLS